MALHDADEPGELAGDATGGVIATLEAEALDLQISDDLALE